MNTVVIEHVTLNELPAAWRARLPVASNVRVTVRIEEEVEEESDKQPTLSGQLADNPLFGMWQDREDMGDVAAYVRRLRAPRYDLDGSHHED